MSCTEKHIGKLKKVNFDTDGDRDIFFKNLCEKHGYNNLTLTIYRTPYTYKNWEDLYWNELGFEGELFRVNNDVYELIEHFKTDDDICKFWKNPDDTISFVAEFYNGGTCLSEIIDYEVKELNKN